MPREEERRAKLAAGRNAALGAERVVAGGGDADGQGSVE